MTASLMLVSQVQALVTKCKSHYMSDQ